MTRVRLERAGAVVTLRLQRSEKLNAMDAAMYGQINADLREIDHDDTIRAAVITGGPEVFCAGADLNEHGDEPATARWPSVQVDGYDRGMTMSKPVVAAINGYCLGAGLELALFCDIRIASERAIFGAPEVRWGLLHNYGAHRLPHLIGRGEASRMLLTGDHIDADEAHRVGLVQEIVTARDSLARAQQLANRIADNAPLSVRATKELVDSAEEVTTIQAVRRAAALATLLNSTQDVREGAAAFQEKRPPTYRGR